MPTCLRWWPSACFQNRCGAPPVGHSQRSWQLASLTFEGQPPFNMPSGRCNPHGSDVFFHHPGNRHGLGSAAARLSHWAEGHLGRRICAVDGSRCRLAGRHLTSAGCRPHDGHSTNDIDEGAERPAPKLFRQDGRIDWRRTTAEVVEFHPRNAPFPRRLDHLEWRHFQSAEGQDPCPSDIEPTATWPMPYLIRSMVGGHSRCSLFSLRTPSSQASLPCREDILRGYRYPAELGSGGH